MAALGITVLKNNVPWGPFTRAQIEEGLARGDFTLQYLAHAPGLKEWLPLGEVLDYVERHEARAAVAAARPGRRELPPVPIRPSLEPPIAAPCSSRPTAVPPAAACPRTAPCRRRSLRRRCRKSRTCRT